MVAATIKLGSPNQFLVYARFNQALGCHNQVVFPVNGDGGSVASSIYARYVQTLCTTIQVSTYVQTLWRLVAQDDDQTMYNGGVSVLTTLLGVVATWSVGKIKSGAAIMWLAPTCSTFAGVLLLVAARSTSLYIQYVAYGTFKMFGYVILTLASAEVARSAARVADCPGLVFGVNAVVALLIQSLITMIVTGRGGFQLAVREQYHVYGGYFIVMGAIYGMAVAIVKSVRSWPSPEDRLPVSVNRSKPAVRSPTKT